MWQQHNSLHFPPFCTIWYDRQSLLKTNEGLREWEGGNICLKWIKKTDSESIIVRSAGRSFLKLGHISLWIIIPSNTKV